MSGLGPSKPSWMRQAPYAELLRTQPRCCRHCESVEDLEVDHVRARHDGGSDDLSNLQILCGPCNRAKGTRADRRWVHGNYFDQELPPDRLRTAQLTGAYLPIVHHHAGHFARPFSAIARELYTLVWVTGAGKTLAPVVLACALNHLIRREHGPSAPRVDRVLVLTKETAIRDQIAEALGGVLATRAPGDLTRYGILPRDPRVGTVHDGESFDDPLLLEECDVWVACAQQLWTRDGVPRRDLARILARFPLIAVDEPHFAHEQVLRVVEEATTSLCFGLTGSPIDGMGALLERMRLFSLFSYQDAHDNDQSVKFLGDDDAALAEIVQEIRIDSAEARVGETTTLVQNVRQVVDYPVAHEAKVAVARAVALHLKASDEQVEALADAEQRRARHRSESGTALGRGYPAHALIAAGSVAEAQLLERFLNDLFATNRRRFPREEGWTAAAVYAGHGEQLLSRARRPLTPDHGWYRYQRSGVLDAQCCRILVCDGMGREGVDNRYCTTTAIATGSRSPVEVVQRLIGRALRSVVERRDGVLVAPPAILDTVRIITHEAFGNRATIEAGIRFVVDMGGHVGSLPTMDDLVEDEQEPLGAAPRAEFVLSDRDRIAVFGAMGRAERARVPFDPATGVRDWSTMSEPKRAGVRALARAVVEDRAIVASTMLNADIRPRQIVMRESLQVVPTDEELRRFLGVHYPTSAADLPYSRWEEAAAAAIRRGHVALYAQWWRAFQDHPIAATTTLREIKMHAVNGARRALGAEVVGAEGAVNKELFRSVALAVQGVFGAWRVREESSYNTPRHHAMLLRPEVQREVQAFVRARMVRAGFVPDVAFLLGLDDEDSHAAG